MNKQQKSDWWQRRAKLAAIKINLGWTLRLWLPWAVGVSAVFACVVLVAKRGGIETQPWWLWFVGSLAATLMVSLWRLRGRLFTARDGMVRLEGQLRLNNALTTASDGLGDWPQPRRGSDGLRWRFDRILAPPVAVALLLTVAWRMPVEVSDVPMSTAAVEPVAWQQVDNTLDQLANAEAITPESVAEFREKLDSLREQPREEWYRHASLEAGDELRAQLNREVKDFAEALQLASETVAEIGANSELASEISERQLQRLSAAVADAMQQMGASGLGLDPKLAQQLGNLQNLDPGALKNLSASQMQQLREALQKAASQCRGAGGQTVDTGQGGDCEGPGCSGNCSGSGNGNCQGQGQGQGMGPGRGGITRGPGAAPLNFGQETERGSDRLEGASNDDVSRAGLADQVGQSTGSHQVDRTTNVSPTNSAGIASGGDGGQAVWRNNLSPAERNVLKEFYK